MLWKKYVASGDALKILKSGYLIFLSFIMIFYETLKNAHLTKLKFNYLLVQKYCIYAC